MGSASEDIQDPSEDARSKTTPSTGKLFSLNVGLQSLTSVQRKDQFIPGDDYAPKVRKQYTITKQRERWTEEEHKKFLEALKLYGRAWRRIEEHVGTKTAVQIRSHAQKFFSKVVRESSSNEESIVKPIEIPPPRPKRKPMHPYPRKMVSPVKTEGRLSDEHRRSASPNLSISGQENQSLTSVLSALGSDTTGATDSNTPNGSSSPDSSAADDQPKGLFPSEAIQSPEENGSENGSSSPTHENDSLTQYDQVPMKLELFPEVGAFLKEDSSEVASTQSLKLFGKTVIVAGPSSSNSGNCNSQPTKETDERPVQTSSWNLTPGVRFTPTDAECGWNGLSCGAPALYYMQIQNENSDSVEEVAASPLPCWTFNGGVSYPILQLHNSVPEKEYVYSDGNKVQDKGVQKDGSRTGSNSGSVNAGGDGDKTWDTETQSCQPFFEEEESEQKPTFFPKRKDEVALAEQKMNKAKCLKGFVPYKRCLAERGSSSTLTGEEREDQRMRLCL